MESTVTEGRPSEARSRLLSAASTIFYTQGIRAVGVDHIIAAAQVTRATLYRHFPGKEDLVLAYLDTAHQAIRRQVGVITSSGRPAATTIRALSRSIAEDIR